MRFFISLVVFLVVPKKVAMEDEFVYGVAKICTSGHVITIQMLNNSIDEKYCIKCGSPIINKCQSCDASIKGGTAYPYHGSFIFHSNQSDWIRPAFCRNCGKPFPWTLQAGEAANELIEFATTLNDQEKDEWKKTIPVIISNSPKTEVALVKFKHFAAKAGNEIGKGVKDIIINVVSEVVKNALLK